MGFDDCNEVAKSGLFFKLEGNKDTDTVVVMGEPEHRESSGMGRKRVQFCFPVCSLHGAQVWAVGVRLYKEFRDNWKKYYKKAVKVTRHGDKGDTSTTYDLDVVKGSKVLWDTVKELEEGDLQQALDDALSIGASD